MKSLNDWCVIWNHSTLATNRTNIHAFSLEMQRKQNFNMKVVFFSLLFQLIFFCNWIFPKKSCYKEIAEKHESSHKHKTWELRSCPVPSHLLITFFMPQFFCFMTSFHSGWLYSFIIFPTNLARPCYSCETSPFTLTLSYYDRIFLF